jgi:hypothetical protein
LLSPEERARLAELEKQLSTKVTGQALNIRTEPDDQLLKADTAATIICLLAGALLLMAGAVAQFTGVAVTGVLVMAAGLFGFVRTRRSGNRTRPAKSGMPSRMTAPANTRKGPGSGR